VLGADTASPRAFLRLSSLPPAGALPGCDKGVRAGRPLLDGRLWTLARLACPPSDPPSNLRLHRSTPTLLSPVTSPAIPPPTSPPVGQPLNLRSAGLKRLHSGPQSNRSPRSSHSGIGAWAVSTFVSARTGPRHPPVWSPCLQLDAKDVPRLHRSSAPSAVIIFVALQVYTHPTLQLPPATDDCPLNRPRRACTLAI